MRKLNEVKVLRDPIFGSIPVEYEVIWNCLNAKEFQRLRRIRQLGGSFLVYHGAQHNRFAHSLGVYNLVRRMVTENNEISMQLSEYEKVVAMCAGLLHDIGHFPYSHVFESITKADHEEYTQKVILEDTDVHKALVACDERLPKDVADVINHSYHNVLVVQMVSGQLDADRMDYLLRDSYYCGVKYGEFDLERILRTLRVKDGRIVVKESGISAVEDYIMARYQMYWQVYFHPISRSYETLLASFFDRLKYLYELDKNLVSDVKGLFCVLEDGPITVQQHFYLDEALCEYCFNALRNHPDKILSDLASRLLDRNLFEYADALTDEQIMQMRQKVIDKGYDPQYYFKMDSAKQVPYKPYSSSGAKSILALNKMGEVVELSKASVLVEAIVKGKDKQDPKMYFPKECL